MVLSGVQNIALQDLHTGESIANSYVLEEQIGLGGMGAVYRARHQLLGRLCALKFLLPSAVSATSWEMFKNEAKILNELQHPAICRIFDMGLHKGCLPFYAMEFLDGITLEELLNRKNTLGLGGALEIFIAVADALSYAHRQKIIHKDVKPANIMLVKAAKNTIVVKLLDFGIAELSESGATTAISEVAGSAAYMSPEQFSGRPLTPASDVYSLACSLFETLAGDAPFDGQNFDELSQQHQELPAPTLKEFTALDFPPDIEVVLEHALRKDPERRYRYMSEITIDLQRILQGKPLQFARSETARLATAFDDEVNLSEFDPGIAKKNGRLRLWACLL
jgi:serine/threonine-protein kinase